MTKCESKFPSREFVPTHDSALTHALQLTQADAVWKIHDNYVDTLVTRDFLAKAAC